MLNKLYMFSLPFDPLLVSWQGVVASGGVVVAAPVLAVVLGRCVLGHAAPLGGLRSESVRDELKRRLPAWVQPIITAIAGVAPTDAEPQFIWTRLTINAAGLMVLCGGVALTFGGLAKCGVLGSLAVAVGMVTATGGARALMTTLLHDLVHYLAVERAKYGPAHKGKYWYLGESVAWLIQVGRFQDYFREHMAHHQVSVFAREHDPDYQFLLSLGFHRGMTIAECWRRFILLLLSPWYYVRFAAARLWSRTASPISTVGTIVYWAMMIYLGETVVGWPVLAAAWLVPCLVGLPAAALTQFTSEHRWGAVRDGSQPRATEDAKLTSARFCADYPPTEGLPLWTRLPQWAVWWLRLLTLHATVRVAVLPLDLPHHDLHHIAAFERLRKAGVVLPPWANWMNGAFARQLYMRHRRSTDPVPTEIWGIGAALDATFSVWASLPSSRSTTAGGDVPIVFA